MSRTASRQRAPADLEAAQVYAAEDRAGEEAGTRRYTTFADLVAHVDRIVCSSWWDELFPDAPIEVGVVRRSRNATFSAAKRDFAGESAVVAIIDGRHWNLVAVLHELAHVAVGPGHGHGRVFRTALAELWRREAGIVAQVCLLSEFDAAGLSY